LAIFTTGERDDAGMFQCGNASDTKKKMGGQARIKTGGEKQY